MPAVLFSNSAIRSAMCAKKFSTFPLIAVSDLYLINMDHSSSSLSTNCSSSISTPSPQLLDRKISTMNSRFERNYSTKILSGSKNLELVLANGISKHRSGVMAEETEAAKRKSKPLVVMLAWMLARQKHLAKYAEIYLKRGYDVLTVTVSPLQLLWPVNGCQLVAEQVLQFLTDHNKSEPIILHGFSVGAYVWGEVMVKMNENLPRYQPILDRIVGQTWDSAADLTEITVGLPLAAFPNNPFLRSIFAKYISFHLKTFHDSSTFHYLRASNVFHSTLVTAPALLLVSELDPVGTASSNKRIKDIWESMGIKMYWKCWEDSKHVSHFLKYKDEYTQILERFLDSIDAAKDESSRLNKFNLHANRETTGIKLRAKL